MDRMRQKMASICTGYPDGIPQLYEGYSSLHLWSFLLIQNCTKTLTGNTFRHCQSKMKCAQSRGYWTSAFNNGLRTMLYKEWRDPGIAAGGMHVQLSAIYIPMPAGWKQQLLQTMDPMLVIWVFLCRVTHVSVPTVPIALIYFHDM
jgi:hypothetical protein